MNEGKICTHHIGSRGGSLVLPLLSHFESDIVSVMYDADKDCAKHVASVNRDNRSETIVFSECIGGKNCEQIFNLNKDPASSSLRRISQDKKNWYFYFRKTGVDMILGEAIKPMKSVKMRVTTLDSFLSKNKKIPPPDFLSLDTQGTEYEILASAHRTLAEETVAIVSEVSFREIYKKQKLFGDLCAFLSRQGFSFVAFTKYILDISPSRRPVGLRGEGFQSVTDALFFRDISSVRNTKDAVKRARKFQKLAFFSCLFNQFEYGLACLDEAHKAKLPPPRLAYEKFLDELYHLASRVPQKYPRTINAPSPIVVGTNDPFVDFVMPRSVPDSKIENLFRKYGLAAQADILKKYRLIYEPSLK